MERETGVETSFPWGDRRLSSADPARFIAEIGVNHEGSLDAALLMVEAAAHAGADAIKLQTLSPERNYEKGSPSYEVFSRAQLRPEETEEVFSRADELGMIPFSTVGDLETLQWLLGLNPKLLKVSSGLLTCVPLLQRVSESRIPAVVSTGMALQEDVDQAMKILNPERVCLLHCVSLYPTPLDQVNLAAMRRLRSYGTVVGYSDHCLGEEVVLYAVAAGAKLIEKHFTLDRRREGFDHGIAAEPEEFRRMVDRARELETVFGSPDEELSEDLRQVRSRMQRYVVAKENLPGGTVVDDSMVLFMRLKDGEQGGAIPASDAHSILGRTLRGSVRSGEILGEDRFEPKGEKS